MPQITETSYSANPQAWRRLLSGVILASTLIVLVATARVSTSQTDVVSAVFTEILTAAIAVLAVNILPFNPLVSISEAGVTHKLGPLEQFLDTNRIGRIVVVESSWQIFRSIRIVSTDKRAIVLYAFFPLLEIEDQLVALTKNSNAVERVQANWPKFFLFLTEVPLVVFGSLFALFAIEMYHAKRGNIFDSSTWITLAITMLCGFVLVRNLRSPYGASRGYNLLILLFVALVWVLAILAKIVGV